MELTGDIDDYIGWKFTIIKINVVSFLFIVLI